MIPLFDREFFLIVCEMHQIVIAFVVEELSSRCVWTFFALNQVFQTKAFASFRLVLLSINFSSYVTLFLTIDDCRILDCTFLLSNFL